MVAYSPILIVRVIQIILAILVLALSANTIHGTENYYGFSFYFTIDGYSLFCSIWTLLVVGYFIIAPMFVSVIAIPILGFVIEIITTIFWFSAWIALATLWGPGSCRSISWCSTGKASIAFACFTWLSFMATTILIIISSLPYFHSKGFSQRIPFEVGGTFPHVTQPATGPSVAPGNSNNIDLEAHPSNKEQFTPEVSHNNNNAIPPAGTGI